MNSFKEFWGSAHDSKLPSSSSSKPMPLSVITQTSLSLGISAITTRGLLRLGEDHKQFQTEKFSDEVAKYATSNEVISELSNSIGEPKQNETEDEFVERASTALRAILRNKFKV